MKILFSNNSKDRKTIDRILAPDQIRNPEIEKKVLEIISEVRKKGDKALIEFTRRFDHVSLKQNQLKVTKVSF